MLAFYLFITFLTITVFGIYAKLGNSKILKEVYAGRGILILSSILTINCAIIILTENLDNIIMFINNIAFKGE